MNKISNNKSLWAAMYVDRLLTDEDAVMIEFAMESDPELEMLIKRYERQSEEQFKEMEEEQRQILAEMTAATDDKEPVVKSAKGADKTGKGRIVGLPQRKWLPRLAMATVIILGGGLIWYLNQMEQVHELSVMIPYYEENYQGGTGFGSNQQTKNAADSTTLQIKISSSKKDTTYKYERSTLNLRVPTGFVLDTKSLPSLRHDNKSKTYSLTIGKKQYQIERGKPEQKLQERK